MKQYSVTLSQAVIISVKAESEEQAKQKALKQCESKDEWTNSEPMVTDIQMEEDLSGDTLYL